MAYGIKKNKPNFLEKIDGYALGFFALAAGAIELRIDGVLWQTLGSILIASVIGFATIALNTNWLSSKSFKKFLQREGVLPIIFLLVLVGMFVGLMTAPHEAFAQLYLTPEADIKTAIDTATGGSTAGTAMKTIVTVFFLFARIALGVAFIGTVIKIGGKLNDEENFKEIIRTPVILFSLVTVGDYALAYIF